MEQRERLNAAGHGGPAGIIAKTLYRASQKYKLQQAAGLAAQQGCPKQLWPPWRPVSRPDRGQGRAMKFFYEGRDAQGKMQRGAIEAGSEREALLKLRQSGFAEPRLLSSENTAFLRNDLNQLSGAELQRHARAEIAFGKTRTLAGEILLSLWRVTRINAGYLLMAVAYLGWALHLRSPVRLGIALVVLCYPYAMLFWNRRHLDHYRELQRAMALGQWAEARRQLALMRTKRNMNELTAYDLDVREVQINVREGMPVEQALRQLERWRERKKDSKGSFHSTLVRVYLAARDYPAYLGAARAYYAAQPEADGRKVELVLAETRFGDPVRARQLLDSIDRAQLVPVAQRFYDWASGLLALSEGNTAAALPFLEKTVDHYRESSRKAPVGLSMLAISTAAYAVALARSGRKAEGQALLKDVDQPLRLSIWPGLQHWLETELDWQGWAAISA